jgi:hypothetical protein
MERTLRSLVSVLVCSLACAQTFKSDSDITPCSDDLSMAPRITQECEALLNENIDYPQKLNDILINRKVFPEHLELIFTFGDGPEVNSICVLNSSENPITPKLKRAIRNLARISPPKNLSCLSHHHAELHFSFEFDSENTRELLEKGNRVH